MRLVFTCPTAEEVQLSYEAIARGLRDGVTDTLTLRLGREWGGNDFRDLISR